ncbi:hypothetical protein HYPBUDRAFT_108893 [Hyphopichia burtonii NRRL Y-1933]|uniref:Uncharacterized protein n=1 Tax=Hyphopichia burtonii NRRL Y-1933 TaxID=984485 RepID=A0A1E4RJ76_9ASCO|nr:hypothetical protein HYPBUDRAFT_108893 [Hyphopichia burtonii NRRL Y-1933]ODV67303.1 hypothetical protein HYPBUDRAFT_108893 [Hyphopichia burtonii NRRL Y-1933]
MYGSTSRTTRFCKLSSSSSISRLQRLTIATYFSSLFSISISTDLNSLIFCALSSRSFLMFSKFSSCSSLCCWISLNFLLSSSNSLIFSDWNSLVNSSSASAMSFVCLLMSFSSFFIAITSLEVFSLMISIFCLMESTLEF